MILSIVLMLVLVLVTGCRTGGSESPVSPIFEKSKQAFPSVPTWKISLADLDEDGDLDAVFANGQTNDSQVWLNDGYGFFTDTGQQLGKYGHGIDVGDVDGDGDPDLIISTHSDFAVSRVYLNDGNAVFQALEGAFDANIGFSVELFDTDGDGDLDAVGEGTSATNVYLNNGAGTFSPSEITLPLTTVWGDLDSDGDVDVFIKEDGDLDLVLTDYMEPCQIWLNDGSGQFADSGVRFGKDQFYRHVHLGDLDGDGDLDIFLATFGVSNGPNEIWFNNHSAIQTPTASEPAKVRVRPPCSRVRIWRGPPVSATAARALELAS